MIAHIHLKVGRLGLVWVAKSTQTESIVGGQVANGVQLTTKEKPLTRLNNKLKNNSLSYLITCILWFCINLSFACNNNTEKAQTGSETIEDNSPTDIATFAAVRRDISLLK
jgi:hypothetical protein